MTPSLVNPTTTEQSLHKGDALSYKSFKRVPLCVCFSPQTSICLNQQNRDNDTLITKFRITFGTGARQLSALPNLSRLPITIFSKLLTTGTGLISKISNVPLPQTKFSLAQQIVRASINQFCVWGYPRFGACALRPS